MMQIKILKISISIILATTLILAFSTIFWSSRDVAGKTFNNCIELNKTYKGGIAKSASIKNKGGKTNYTPFVSKEIYEAHVKMDKDKDGIACER